MPGLTGIAGVQAVVASRGFRPPAEHLTGRPVEGAAFAKDDADFPRIAQGLPRIPPCTLHLAIRLVNMI